MTKPKTPTKKLTVYRPWRMALGSPAAGPVDDDDDGDDDDNDNGDGNMRW